MEGHTHEYPELDVLSILQQKQHFWQQEHISVSSDVLASQTSAVKS